jgi:hypothetical protein
MTREELGHIETIVRQQWCVESSPFESWLSVDQDQALAVIEMIPNRLRVHPALLKDEGAC